MSKRKSSIQKKVLLAFSLLIIIIMSITLLLHIRTIKAMRSMTYEKMEANVDYYQQAFETEIQHILKLQVEFFNDRNLPFLAGRYIEINDYEKRDALLSIRERLGSITGISNLIDTGVLYIPKSGYYITDNNIRRMTEEDMSDMKAYLQNNDGELHFDGQNFYTMRTGEISTVFSKDPNYLFVLTFSTQQVEELLYSLNTSDNSGAFIYNEAEDVIVESSSTAYVGKEIMNMLTKEEDGSYTRTQQIQTGGEEYLVMVGNKGKMGLFVQYVEMAPVMNYINQSWVYTVLFLLAMMLLSFLFAFYIQKIIHKPLNILIKAFECVMKGNLDEHIYRNKNDEFTYLFKSFNDMEDRLKQLIDDVYVQKNLAQKAQLKQLQAQINPHFLYNSFFTLKRRIKRQDYENAEEFAKHLSNYFKYLTKDGRDYIPLRQEVEHAGSYAAIQKARFAERVEVVFEELPEGWGDILVPRLILQPLLENAFEHGLEDKETDGLLCVTFQTSENELRIQIEDNGDRVLEEDIESMRRSLGETELDEVTGIINIHRRLKIFFKGNAGLKVNRSEMGGVLVTVFIHMAGEIRDGMDPEVEE